MSTSSVAAPNLAGPSAPATVPEDAKPAPRPGQVWRQWLPSSREGMIFAAVLMLVALALRIGILQASNWLQEGDDAVNTVMGLRIMDGERPIVLVGQHYALASQPYLMALSFALFGVSRVAAKLPDLLLSWALVWAVWLFARDVAGPLAGRLAAVFMAVPGAFFLVQSVKPWAPYTEVMLVCTLAILASIRYWRAPTNAAGRPWALAAGVLIGFGFTLHPVSIYYWVPFGLPFLAGLWRRRQFLDVPIALAGFMFGLGPLILYNLQTDGSTVTFLFGGSTHQKWDHGEVFDLWWNHDLPLAIGVWAAPAWPRRYVSMAVVAVFVAALLWALLHGRRLRLRDWQLRPMDIPLILLLMVPVVFVFSGFGGQGINPWGFDATSRYSIHLWPPLAVVLGAFVAHWWPRGRWLAALLGAGVLVFNGYSIARTDAVQAFQSPYWEKLPADNGNVLAVLHQQGVNAIWANHWAGYVLMFDARANGDRLIAYDWYDVAAGGMDRFPDDRARVVNAPKTAFVLVTDEEDPELAQRLRDLQVSYDQYRAEPYVVIIPTSRIVQATEVLQSLDYRY